MVLLGLDNTCVSWLLTAQQYCPTTQRGHKGCMPVNYHAKANKADATLSTNLLCIVAATQTVRQTLICEQAAASDYMHAYADYPT